VVHFLHFWNKKDPIVALTWFLRFYAQWLPLVPRTSPIVIENIPTILDNDDLLFYDTYGTPTFELEGSVLWDYTDRLDGNADGTSNGSQSLSLSFGEFLIVSKVMEIREDGFYYDAQGIRHRIVPSMGGPNHWVMYYEVATIAEDHGHVVDEAEVVCDQTTIDISGPSTSSIECIPKIQHTFHLKCIV
jgi:hypothetical protein